MIQSIDQEIKRVLLLEAKAIQSCALKLEDSHQKKAYIDAIEILNSALEHGGKIVITGVGKSGKIAQKIAATLSSTGSLAIYLHPTEGLHGDLGLLTPKDAIIALSYTGNTEELIKLLPSLKLLKTPIISICGKQDSLLASKSNVWLDASVEFEACPHNLAPTTSTTLALAIGDALAIALMKKRNFNSEKFALNHPGGSLGRRLTLKIQEIMHQGVALPLLVSDSSFDEVIMTMTEKKLGTVIITQSKENQKLVGIITDGDLRRSLKHRAGLFKLKASDMMTPNPISGFPEMLAQEALIIMEGGSRKITALPVVDSSGAIAGLIHIHDLIHFL